MQPEPWFKDFIPDFRPITDLPPGMDGGSVFTSVCINTALYLPWLASQCLKLGVKVRRGNVSVVTEINAGVVVNATGLSSLKLGGVEDKQLYPARGQITIVRNDPGNFMGVTSGVDDGPDEAAYIMHRAAGGGCVLGGCLQKDNWDPEVDQAMAQRIMKRAVELCPQLSSNGVEGLDVIRHGVGLRPMRHGGAESGTRSDPRYAGRAQLRSRWIWLPDELWMCTESDRARQGSNSCIKLVTAARL